MAKLKFTSAALIKHFVEADALRTIAWDSDLRGLGAYRTASGEITLFVQYRLANGRQRKKVLRSTPIHASDRCADMNGSGP